MFVKFPPGRVSLEPHDYRVVFLTLSNSHLKSSLRENFTIYYKKPPLHMGVTVFINFDYAFFFTAISTDSPLMFQFFEFSPFSP